MAIAPFRCRPTDPQNLFLQALLYLDEFCVVSTTEVCESVRRPDSKWKQEEELRCVVDVSSKEVFERHELHVDLALLRYQKTEDGRVL
ncbi:hypothetical protein L596_012461 [Steinernema carpocapsae]|uniref:Uncharacterized protein n=1 Tax=Steinernema carpocapsae TaxID=34508 RepID=A0A4U5NX25_STECR|nr:hypothetical protein L596_019828 [Steinernema carpocapsae]TKR88167.1 hypothetical protein L596_012453 [Steinernema carpocapsae]TKR88176.1 hypothetical protein L596_012461 [Steinernema carpocapsae]